MPYLSTTAFNRALGNMGITRLSLHRAFSSTGLNEFSGSGYLRQVVTFSTLDGFLIADTLPASTSVADFSVPADTVAFVGFWDELETFLGMVPISATGVFAFTLGADLQTLTYMSNTALNDSLQVAVWNGFGQVPIVAEGGIFYVVNPTETTTQLSATQFGLPVTFANTGGGFLQIVAPVIFSAPGTFSVNAVTISPFAVS